jgi:YD repeat-containing protein
MVQYSDATPKVTQVWDLGAYGIRRLHSVSNAIGGQLKRLSHGTIANPRNLLDYQYDYGEYSANNGLIEKIVNYRDRTKDVQFTYDAFYRLSAAETAGSHWGLAWTYDRYGNQLTQTASKGTRPNLEC